MAQTGVWHSSEVESVHISNEKLLPPLVLVVNIKYTHGK